MKEKMKEKIRVIIMLFLVIGVIVSSFTNVKAHSVELDPNSLIRFPMLITNGKGEISIDDSETGYTLYYQAVEISNTDYEQMQEITNTGEKELEAIKTEIDELKAESDNLRKIYDEAYEAYKEKLDADVTGTELEEAKTAYETAQTNYQNKVEEYNNKVEEYNGKVDEVQTRIKELTPTYIEDNWVETEDGSFSVDISQFSGDKAFAVWAKLESSDGTISYDEATYTMSGTKTENIDVEGITIDRRTLTLQEGSSYTLTATITPTDATNKLITWTSDNEDVATVSNGKITAKSSGTAKITATTNDGEYTATCEVTVVERSSNNSNNNNINNIGNDNTVANIRLPNTGRNILVAVGILTMIIISIISYKIYSRYKNIK